MVPRTRTLDGAERVIEGSRSRLAVLGIVVMFLFSALFTRLWFLQVADSTEYSAAATENRIKVVYEPALRGQILDRNGKPLVENVATDVVTFDRSARLTSTQRTQTIDRLGLILGMPIKKVNEAINNEHVSPYAPVPVATEVSDEARTYIEEHRDEFPGVDVKRVAVRNYPNGPLAAHLLGYVGSITGDELKARAKEGYRQGDLIGKDGVELMFESVLRGKPRRLELAVDNRGRVVRTVRDRPAVPGKDVKLTIDVDIQRVAEESLAQGMDGARSIQAPNQTRYEQFRAAGGSVVALDATDGSVVAMASAPSYDPAVFNQGLTPDEFKALRDDPGNPLVNRAIQGLYAPGSTWKLITAVAALETGQLDPNDPYNDQGCLEVSNETRCNAGKKRNGTVNLSRALTVSSDVYFYELGRDMWQHYNGWKQANDDGQPAPEDLIKKGYAIQDTARKFGFGEPTGIGLPSEQGGRIPDQQWKEEFNRNEPNPDTRRQNSLWFPGDSVNLSVGQGDLVVTPLQLASAYLAFADGGTLYTPRVASTLLQPGTESGQPPTVFRELPAQPVKDIGISPEVYAPIMEGFKGAVGSEDGTARGAFAGYPLGSVAGKTGTAQVTPPKQDTSLFVGILPADAPHYVVATVVEEGGFGADVAAPITRRIMDALNGNHTPEAVGVAPAGVEDD
jgi:penicillin-binding protein 2